MLNFLDFINRQHPNIFYHGIESVNKLAFLYALLRMNATGFDVPVHRQSTFSGLCINYSSYSAHKFKVNCIKSFLSRAYEICYNWQSHLHNEFQYLRTFFFDNGFPMKLFDSCFARFLSEKISSGSDVLRQTRQN